MSDSFYNPDYYDFSTPVGTDYLSTPLSFNLGSGFGTTSPDYLNFGVSDPYNQWPGTMPNFYSNNTSPFSGLEAGTYQPSLWDQINSGVQSVGGWGDVAKFGLGALNAYGLLQSMNMQNKGLDLAEQKLAQDAALQREALRAKQAGDFAKMHAIAQIIQSRQGINVDPSLAYYEAVNREMGYSPQDAASFAGVDVGGPMKVGMSTAQRQAALNAALQQQQFAQGGMYPQGGLARAHGALVRGDSGGQEDDFNAQLSHGEYIMPADVTAALGDGNTESGARKLDKAVRSIRKRARSTSPDKLPPKAREFMIEVGDTD